MSAEVSCDLAEPFRNIDMLLLDLSRDSFASNRVGAFTATARVYFPDTVALALGELLKSDLYFS